MSGLEKRKTWQEREAEENNNAAYTLSLLRELEQADAVPHLIRAVVDCSSEKVRTSFNIPNIER